MQKPPRPGATRGAAPRSSTVPPRHGKQESPSSRPLSQAPVIAVDASLLQPRDCKHHVHHEVESDGDDLIVRVAQLAGGDRSPATRWTALPQRTKLSTVAVAAADPARDSPSSSDPQARSGSSTTSAFDSPRRLLAPRPAGRASRRRTRRGPPDAAGSRSLYRRLPAADTSVRGRPHGRSRTVRGWPDSSS